MCVETFVLVMLRLREREREREAVESGYVCMCVSKEASLPPGKYFRYLGPFVRSRERKSKINR